METRISELTPEQQAMIYKAMCCRFYKRVRGLLLQIEMDSGVRDSYGTTVMTDGDRLNNRLTLNLVISDNGIPDHDKEAQQWIERVLGGADAWDISSFD